MNELLISHLESISPSVTSQLERNVDRSLGKSGILYRIFSRQKFSQSVSNKIEQKNYKKGGKQLQDLFGIRIALYFKDDIEVCKKLISNAFSIREITEDQENASEFKPIRLNVICDLPQEIQELIIPDLWDFPIDPTFEVQIRTVFSEGWHEIEHDFRYKHKKEWESEYESTRTLNGIFATLETCDWSIISLFDQFAYNKYLGKEWEAMLRNTYRIRIESTPLMPEIETILNKNNSLAKRLLKVDRHLLIEQLASDAILNIPKSLNNLVFIANLLYIKDSDILKITPKLLLEKIPH